MKVIVLLLLIGSIALSAQAQPDPASLRGRWAGTVSQEGVRRFQGQEFFYTMDLLITQVLEHEVSGKLRVLEVNCEADLVFRHFADGEFVFFAQPVKNSPANCVTSLIRIKPLLGGKIEYAATFATPDNPRHPGLKGTLNRLISVEAREQAEQ